jgi:dipeptidyl aminopeptidase/acylaminoacyl peptidase
MNNRILPYGTWPASISARDVAATSLRLAQPRRIDGATWWVETRPQEKGRTVLMRADRNGLHDVVPAPFSVQSRVNEYGGGAYAVHQGCAYFVNKADQDVWCIRPGDTEPQRMTREPQRKFADLVHDPERDCLYAICETARDEAHPEHSLVRIDKDGALHTLASGEDFYSSPTPSPDGRELAWLSWSHPNMPWDGTRLWRASINDDALGEPSLVAGSDSESVVQPGWLPDGRLAYVSDRSNWWNLHAEGNENLCPMEAEFGLPHWVFGMRSWSVLDEQRIACAWTQDGSWHAGILHLDNGKLTELDIAIDSIDTLDAADGNIVMLGGSATTFNTVWLHDGESLQALRAAGSADFDTDTFSRPETIRFATGDNAEAFGFYYPPQCPGIEAPADETPPLLVKCHGGPTGATSSLLDMKIQFWTSRGFAVLDVNYRGSTGYGREFRRALYGQWGISDVEDCINGARALAAAGKADPERLLISGSSAGGYTVLNALTFHDDFAAGASFYGVSDPVTVMRDTEKFESRYGDSLIGPLPETQSTWEARSPLLHAARIRCPVIFLQGLDDPIVPPNQSERMVQALRDNGIPVAYLEFPGEGHGFRRADTIERALDSEYAFYCRMLGLAPQLPLPELHINNAD